MRLKFLWLLLIIAFAATKAQGAPSESELLLKLDGYVAKRDYYMQVKERRLDSLKSALRGSEPCYWHAEW